MGHQTKEVEPTPERQEELRRQIQEAVNTPRVRHWDDWINEGDQPKMTIGEYEWCDDNLSVRATVTVTIKPAAP